MRVDGRDALFAHLTDTDLPIGRAPPYSAASVVILCIRVICVLGLLLANYYSWTMTTTGFVNTGLLPDNSVLSNIYIPHVVAGFVQLGILSFYLAVPYFHARYPIPPLLAGFFVISLVVLSALFALFSITKTSQSENIVSYQIGLVLEMNNRIVGLDDQVAATFENYLTELDTLSQRACQGKDKTLIAKCGSIARGHIEKANAVRGRYRSQLGVATTYSIPDRSDIMSGLTSIRGNYARLSQKVEAYVAFSKENDQSHDEVTKQVDALRHDIDAFSRSLNQRNPDTKTMVLTRVFEDIKKAWGGAAEPLVYFALVIAFLPDMLSITFTLILLIMSAANQETLMIRRTVRKAREESKWYKKASSAVKERRENKEEFWNERRRENVSAHVDQSVPDIM